MRPNRVIGYGLPVVGLAACGLALWSVMAQQPHRPMINPTVSPPLQPLDSVAMLPGHDAGFIGAVGLVESASEEVAIGTYLPGVVSNVLVAEGDSVARGTPLFVIDDRQVRAQLAIWEARVATARAKVTAAEVRMRDEQGQLVRAAKLKRGTSISDDALERRQFAADAARADLAVARQEAAELEANVAEVRVQLAQHTIESPLDATVLQVNLRPGEYAAAGSLPTPLMLLGRLDELHLRVDVDEADIGRFAPEACAWASPRGRPEVRAKLRFLRNELVVVPKRSLTSAVSERVDTRVLQLLYRVQERKNRFLVGQQADVFIRSWAPNSAVTPAC
jgi:HlyD family secretion protein